MNAKLFPLENPAATADGIPDPVPCVLAEVECTLVEEEDNDDDDEEGGAEVGAESMEFPGVMRWSAQPSSHFIFFYWNCEKM